MSNQENSSDVVNLRELKEIMDDDMELIEDCFAEFIKDWPELHTEIKHAISGKDARILNAAAHKLKGTLRYLAADPAAEAAFALEAAGREGDWDGIDAMLEELESQCQQLIEYISHFKA